MKKTYLVAGGSIVLGHSPGEEFEAELPHEQENALVYGGALKVLKADKLECPACKEQGKKRVRKFDSLNELREHYGKDHPALAAPAGEEE